MILHKLRNLFTERLASISLLVPLAAAAAILTLAPPPVLAQGQPQGQQQEQFEEEDEEGIEEIVVTGSRIRRSEFSGAVPLQIITAEGSFEAGLLETSEILQSSAQATGTQTDATFGGLVTDGGTGASNVNLRGLDTGRTLILVNGKRLAGAGVGGAPTAPDLNLIPQIMTQRTEIVLDGASSVYGSDAVAGVINIITRKDFEGLEFNIQSALPGEGGGESTGISATWGTVGDNYSIGFGLEQLDFQKITYQDRSWLGCEEERFVGADGKIYRGDTDLYPHNTRTACNVVPLGNRISLQGLNATLGSVYWTPGTSNVGIPNWSETSQNAGFIGSANPALGVRYNRVDTNVKNNYLRATDPMPSYYECITGQNDNFCRDANGSPIPFEFRLVVDADGDPVLDANDDFIVVPGQTMPTVPISPFDTNGYVSLADGSGTVDIYDPFYATGASERTLSGDFTPDFQRLSFYAYGEYDFGDEAGTKLNVDFMYGRRENTSFNPGLQFFPFVPANNPYNPCNTNTDQNPDGIDCRGVLYPAFPAGSTQAQPIVSIIGDRDNSETSVAQYRTSVSLTGDILRVPGNWTYELSAVASLSEGVESAKGILEGPLELALHTAVRDPVTGEVTCGRVADWYGDTDTLGDPENGQVDLKTGQPVPVGIQSTVFRYLSSKGITGGANAVDPDCVPVDLFHADIYQEGGGNLPGGQATRDYLFGSRDFDTNVDQYIGSLIVQGNLATLPWNGTTIPLVLGYEYRQDEIESLPNDVAGLGLFWGFFTDRGATGSRNLNEIFAETSFDLLVDRPFTELLRLELAYRYTDESTFGSDSTYSVKAQWVPFGWLTLRSTLGTSFRAPNAQEQFALGTSGFINITDPCVVPLRARMNAEGGRPGDPQVYDATRDTRLQGNRVDPDGPSDDTNPLLLDLQCQEFGLDFRSHGLDPNIFPTNSTNIFTAGGVVVGGDPVFAETSEARTAGFVIEQDIWDGFELSAALTWYEIEVDNAIARRGAQGVVNACHTSRDSGDKRFCDNFVRNPTTGRIEEVSRGFFNISTDYASGYDLDVEYEKSFIVNDKALDASVVLQASYIEESNSRSTPTSDPFERQDTTYYPRVEGNITFAADYGAMRYTWFARYIKGDEDTFVNTTLGDNRPCAHVLVQCRGVDYTEDYWVHNVSAVWNRNNWLVALGINNVFNEEPPLLNSIHSQVNSNYIIGAGYDIDGRSVVLQMRWANNGF